MAKDTYKINKVHLNKTKKLYNETIKNIEQDYGKDILTQLIHDTYIENPNDYSDDMDKLNKSLFKINNTNNDNTYDGSTTPDNDNTYDGSTTGDAETEEDISLMNTIDDTDDENNKNSKKSNSKKSNKKKSKKSKNKKKKK
eukprot:94415_1